MTKNYEIKEVTVQTLNLVIDFLAQQEYECVSLMKRLLKEEKSTLQKKDCTIFFIKKLGTISQKQTIQGVFLITQGGSLLHHFVAFDFQPLIQPILQKKKLYSIAGTAKGSAMFESILPKAPKTIYNYHLMAYNGLKNTTKNTISLPDRFALRNCSLVDADALYPLQKAYHIQEVLPQGESFSEKNCHIILQNILLEQTVYAIIEKTSNLIVAKAGSSATGLKWVQIGGVYTRPEYRNCGFARYLVQYLAEKSNKNTVLFVKKDNMPAIAAYKKADFSDIGEYRICYM